MNVLESNRRLIFHKPLVDRTRTVCQTLTRFEYTSEIAAQPLLTHFVYSVLLSVPKLIEERLKAAVSHTLSANYPNQFQACKRLF